MFSSPSPEGDLCLGHILGSAGIDAAQVVVIRHTLSSVQYHFPDVRSFGDLTPEIRLKYTRGQVKNNKVGKVPPPLWLVFLADGGRRSRFVMAYDNNGEVEAERTSDGGVFFDLHESTTLASLQNRLVVEWSKDAVNWAKRGVTAVTFPVVEIADPAKVSFPGFDKVLIDYSELRDVINDSRYESWRTALGSVQGIYVITDTSTGKLYIGKADGGERILGRWAQYAKDGHGGNVGLRELAGLDPDHASHYQFSILRVFGPSVPTAEVDAAEAHYKNALRTRKPYGLNHN